MSRSRDIRWNRALSKEWMVNDFVKGWPLRRNRGKDLLDEMLDSS
jgi:hypothetical protein